MRALTEVARRLPLAAGVALASGALAGGLVRLAAASADPVERAAAALVIVLALAACVGGACGCARGAVGERLRSCGAAALLAALASVTALVVARGSAEGALAALVPAASLLLAGGAASALRRIASRSTGAVLGAALPLALAGTIFVADPFIEWNGADAASAERARWTLRSNPVAALTSVHGGVGLDWQSAKLLYDGPRHGSSGLSVVGQYYPTRPPSPWAWSLAAGVLGTLLLVVPGRRPGC